MCSSDLGQLPDRLLAVLRRIADVVLGRPDDVREPAFQGADDLLCVVDAQRRLREIRQLPSGLDRQAIDVLGRLDELDALGRFSQRADDLGTLVFDALSR